MIKMTKSAKDLEAERRESVRYARAMRALSERVARAAGVRM